MGISAILAIEDEYTDECNPISIANNLNLVHNGERGRNVSRPSGFGSEFHSSSGSDFVVRNPNLVEDKNE